MMSDSLHKIETIRQYLLGKISDEKILEGIEELLFSDEDFCTKVEIVEDELINDFVFGKLNNEDKLNFEKTLENNSDRLAKVKVTHSLREKIISRSTEEKVSFIDSLKAFFRQPIYAGGIALLIIAILIGAILIIRSPNNSELAELKNIYKENRPTESRISEFDYAPFEVTRSVETQTDAEKRKLKIIESDLLKMVDSNPTANNHNALGVFYLSQRKYLEAIKELEESLKIEPNNARFHNDLGVALFESGKSKKEIDFLVLGRASEEFSKSLELKPDFLEALFNKALSLQELNVPQRAKEYWQRYLQIDSNSKWADEARKNLEKIEQNQSGLNKKKEEVLQDFLIAYHNQDEQKIWKIHNSTKGVLTQITLAYQLSRRFLEARKNKDDTLAKESLEALIYIGNLEKEKHADFFFADLAEFYAKSDGQKIDELLKAKDLFEKGIKEYRNGYEKVIPLFEESKKIFEKIGNTPEANISEIWATQFLQDVDRVEEAAKRLDLLIEIAERKQYKLILSSGLDWLGNCEFKKNNISKSNSLGIRSLKVAEESNNEYEIRQNSQGLADVFLDLNEPQQGTYYFSKVLANKDSYFINISQVWRVLQTGNELLGSQKNIYVKIDFAYESLNMAAKLGAKQAIINSYRELTKGLAQKKDFESALRSANEAIKIVKVFEETEEKYRFIGEAYLSSAELKRIMQNCEAAIEDYNSSLELLFKLKDTTYNLYDAHKGKMLCLQQLNKKDDFQKELEIVLKLSEENRQKIKEDNLRQPFFDSQQFVYDAAIANSLSNNDKQKAFQYVEASRSRSLLEFIKSGKSIAEVERDFENIAKPLTLKEIQKQIPENIQIIQFAWLNDKLAIWQITKNSFELTEKSINSEALVKNIDNYKTLIIENKDTEKVQQIAKELYELLLPKELNIEKIICLIPDKSLHQLPFASLISSSGKYLIEDFPIIYSPSSSVFVASTENAKRKNKSESLLTIGNPRFDQTQNPNLNDLPEAEIESKEIGKLYDKSAQFLGSEATKKNFLEGIGSAEIIHYAGHFVTNASSSANSRFVFSDEFLLAFELSEMKLPNSKLVVLSACETGFEKFNRSEGAIGVARTFLAMGTPLVVASNWKVESSSTKDLIISFHRKRILEKKSSIEALRQAQLEMLHNQELSSPYYWSAFSVYGGFAEY